MDNKGEPMFCKRCGAIIDECNLYKVEGVNNIYRCPDCTKPVIVNNGVVKPIVNV